MEFFERADLLFFNVPRYFHVYQDDGQRAEFLLDIANFNCQTGLTQG